MDKALAFIGLAKKAGLLAIGADATAQATKKQKAVLIITSSDASDRSKNNAKKLAALANIKYMSVSYTMQELGTTAGCGAPGTIAFLDSGFAESFAKKLDNT